jgi:hypothetical protein
VGEAEEKNVWQETKELYFFISSGMWEKQKSVFVLYICAVWKTY